MGAPGIVLAWGLCVLPLVLETASGGSLEVRGASRLGLCLLPWLALAGLPRGGGRAQSEAAAALCAPLLALPPLSLAALLDVRQGPGGPGWVELLPPLGTGLVLLLLLSWSAGRGGTVYALSWLLLIAGPAALGAAFGIAASAGTAPAPAALAWLAERSPLGWAWWGARAGSGFPGGAFALACCALLALSTALGRPRGELEPS